jgi:hypothetical protein
MYTIVIKIMLVFNRNTNEMEKLLSSILINFKYTIIILLKTKIPYLPINPIIQH